MTRQSHGSEETWAIPYIDQPPQFWNALADDFGPKIEEVYFPLDESVIGSGRPSLPRNHLEAFLAHAPVRKSALLNAVTLPGPVQSCAPRICDHLSELRDTYGISSATVANPRLAEEVRKRLPEFTLTASTLMNIAHPSEALMINGLVDVLVPGARAVRNLATLRALRKAFEGKIRLLVNEACLGGCPWRAQHFHEMCTGVEEPESLCDGLLVREPWLRLTGAWVLPQHLWMFAGLADQFKLAGRVTLAEPDRYRDVFSAYIDGRELMPKDIGGGPASVIEPIPMPEDLYAYTLQCGQKCHECRRCADYYAEATQPASLATT